VWVAFASEEGHGYWFDASITEDACTDEVEDSFAGTSTWQEPPGWASAPWGLHWDGDSNAWFYANELTAETRWDPPTCTGGEGASSNSSSNYGSNCRSGGSSNVWQETVGANEEEGGGQGGWEACWDKSEETWYWYDAATGESQWAEAEPASGDGGYEGGNEGSVPAAAAEEWGACWDEDTGAWFWFNSTTGESQWAEAYENDLPSHL
jgi:hypothetical protein